MVGNEKIANTSGPLSDKNAITRPSTYALDTPSSSRHPKIRVHALEGLGFALVGDPVYGRGGTKTRTLLHAERLVVKRDVKPSIIAEAPFPDSFIALGFAAPEGAEPTRG